MQLTVPYTILITTSSILSIAAALLCILTGAILAYHWFRFARNPLSALLTLGIYAAGCVILLALMFSIGPTLAL